jgi:hypothetical protein
MLFVFYSLAISAISDPPALAGYSNQLKTEPFLLFTFFIECFLFFIPL